ncbi:MAG: magnesium transporter [Burkholderiales bacterium]|nr:magnesium transporter [Burkholderiales bacterium]
MEETQEKIREVVRAENVQESLEQVMRLLHRLELVEELERRNDKPRPELISSLAHRENVAPLRNRLDRMHPADVAYVLQALPLNQRLVVWELVKAERDGEILLETSDAVRETLIANMDSAELLAAAETLDSDEIADLAPDLPRDVITDLLLSRDAQNRARLQSALSYADDRVGGLMDFDMVAVRPDVTLEVVLRYLRQLNELPDQTDKLFVVDRENVLRGVLPIKRLLLQDPDVEVAEVMDENVVTFDPDDDASDAAQAFERYDLVTAPVVGPDKKLVGRLTVDAVVDFIREERDNEVLGQAGLLEEEDLFASVWSSAKNRWLWLAINLVTAFIASRVIGVFEGTIEKLVALAALMPIIAGIGGNSGIQTTTLIVRGLALGQINAGNARMLITKELTISALNGVVWGSVVGAFAFAIYGSASLGIVMAAAMLLNLLLAALVGIFIPLTMYKLGRDPAIGSSVLLTATTDSMGFFIFLGLASIFLV